jgi:hypothetical protein
VALEAFLAEQSPRMNNPIVATTVTLESRLICPTGRGKGESSRATRQV